jgi:hypothetical protein
MSPKKLAMEINSTDQRLRADPAAGALANALRDNVAEWDLEQAQLYVDFPLFREDDALIISKALVVSRRHGVIVFGTYSGDALEGPELARVKNSLDQVFTHVYGRLIKYRTLKASRTGLKFEVSAAIFAPDLTEWTESIRQDRFCIKLGDGSLIQFREVAKPAFAFLESPMNVVSLADFARSLGATRAAEKYRFQVQYDEYVATAEAKDHVSPIRFEYDLEAYESGKHPIAHVHIGCENDIRIAVDKILTPASFVFLVLRLHYPDAWLRVLSSNLRDSIHRTFRKSLGKVEGFPQKDDHCELFFT